MALKFYHIDSFTDKLFSGNPAGVCPLEDKWPDDSLMQKIAEENCLAETTFYLRKDNEFFIRWFTPEVEVDLCGHGTLAAACVLFEFENYSEDHINFQSKSGLLSVRKNEDYYTLDFPADQIKKIGIFDEIKNAFDISPVEVYRGRSDLMLIYSNEEQIRKIQYDLSKISVFDSRGVIITAPGYDVDFVSRFFAPQIGIPEDPVTGSAHTTLAPYWSKKLDKTDMTAMQLSKRQGFLKCKYVNDRIEISGKAAMFSKGEINI